MSNIGWRNVRGEDYCPSCVEDRRREAEMRKGELMNLDVILSPSRLNACAEKRERYSVARPPTAADYAAVDDARDLFWLLGALGVERKLIVLAACACARWALPYWEREYPNDDRPRRCIEITEAWCRGHATMEEVQAAAAAAYAAYAASAASAAASCAAAAAAYTSAASCAAAAAYTSAASCATVAASVSVSAAHTSALRDLADVVRQVVPWPLVHTRATELGLMEPVS